MTAIPGQNAIADRDDRMARFAAGARRLVVRAVHIGAVMAAGWLLAVLFGMLTAAPAAADSTAATGAKAATGASADAEAGSTHLPALVGAGGLAASDNAEAMAGRTVAGLNSQQDPGLPSPSTAGKILDSTNGLVPNGGGSGPFGPVSGDVARSLFDPRPQAWRAPVAYVLPPLVRTAADDPSFSPD
ncbi:hypothetical protein MF672_009455 [Actinomadura sp. ATCC 31491]|uniref:Uncharacterized protein n=1 Tax=Actinomadura luzonensis TaxID=2805427 RepID=A0ABT0FNT9_9ACTN|nr:hypothetical protein [Actinomadura luzonensis]MCK2214015.1 hypothetical protein [Actinomadura luzonensis]